VVLSGEGRPYMRWNNETQGEGLGREGGKKDLIEGGERDCRLSVVAKRRREVMGTCDLEEMPNRS